MVFQSNWQEWFKQCTKQSNVQYIVIDGGGETDWCDMKSGVRQGCVISGFFFLLVVDWVGRP